mmetsp:Transcript_149/g.163  ORF Transcript_149/g.163 Transcript_149/m.163 type:complete len:106 (+) Transcript_149:1122-1439(+)
MGDHTFTYSILPHERPLEESNVFAEAHKLNNPLWVGIIDLPEAEEEKMELQQSLHSKRYLEIDQSNVVVSAFKYAEESNNFVLRLHEERGEQVMAKVQLAKELGI